VESDAGQVLPRCGGSSRNPRRVNRRVPRPLDAVCLKAMARASCAATDRAAAQIFVSLFLSQVTDCVATLDWLGWSPLRLKARKSHAWPTRSNAGSSCKRYLGAHK
jgi:hypothetical protein